MNTIKEIHTEHLRLGFLPAAGGRLISLATREGEFLWRNPDLFTPDLRPTTPVSNWPEPDGTMSTWLNPGGSKTWPAPQGWQGSGQWPGPPDPVLDSGGWSFTQLDLDGATRITMVSPADRRTGLEITREFTIPHEESAFTQVNTFRNIAQEHISWAVWEVCQVDSAAGGRVRVAVEDGGEPVRLLNVDGEVDIGRLEGGEWVVPVQGAVGKLGYPSADGYIAFDAPGVGSVQIGFQAEPGATYPDQGSRAEIWFQHPVTAPFEALGGLHPRHHLVEIEVLGPLVTFGPGEETSLELHWSIT